MKLGNPYVWHGQLYASSPALNVGCSNNLRLHTEAHGEPTLDVSDQDN